MELTDDNPDEKLLREVFRYNESFSAQEADLAKSRYEYLLSRRDNLQDRMRNGVLVLNSVSLLGVLTALGTDKINAGDFGLQISDLAFCAICFMVGLNLAVTGYFSESLHIPQEAACQYDRLSRQMRQRASLSEVATERNIERFKEAMDEAHKKPQSDFGYSAWSLASVNFAGGAWICGIALAIWRIGHLISFY